MTPPIDTETLAERLRLARITRRYSQEELAERAGVQQSQVSRIERAQVAAPAFADVAALGEALGISLSALAQTTTTAFVADLARVADEVDGETTETEQDETGELPMVDDPYSPAPGTIPFAISREAQNPSIRALAADEMRGTTLIAGVAGSGKTELMKWLALGAVRNGYATMLVDMDGAAADGLMKAIIGTCPERADDVLLVELGGRTSNPPGINPLDVSSPEEIPVVLASVEEMLASTIPSPKTLELARQAVAAMCEANLHIDDPDGKSTLLHLPSFFVDPEYRRLVMEFCANVVARETFNPETSSFECMTEQQQVQLAMPIIRAIQPLASSDAYTATFGSSQNKLDLAGAVADGKVIIVKTSGYPHQRQLGKMAAALLLPWMLGSIQREAGASIADDQGLRIFIDAAPELLTPGSQALQALSDSARRDIGLAVTCQYVEQFDRAALQQLLAHPGVRVALRSDPVFAAELSRWLWGNSRGAPDISDLPLFTYLARTPAGPVERLSALPPLGGRLSSSARSMLAGMHQSSAERLRGDGHEVRTSDRLDHIKGHLAHKLIAATDAAAPSSPGMSSWER